MLDFNEVLNINQVLQGIIANLIASFIVYYIVTKMLTSKKINF